MAKEGNGSGTLSFGSDHEYVDDDDDDGSVDPHDDDEDDGVHDGGGDGHEKMM